MSWTPERGIKVRLLAAIDTVSTAGMRIVNLHVPIVPRLLEIPRYVEYYFSRWADASCRQDYKRIVMTAATGSLICARYRPLLVGTYVHSFLIRLTLRA